MDGQEIHIKTWEVILSLSLQLIRSDICVPIETRSLSHVVYFLTLLISLVENLGLIF